METVPEGIVAVITNHSWLDNPTFKGMRRSLLRTFNQIYILDLHGSVKKKEQAPTGLVDENVFDIEQGVAISLFVKSTKPLCDIFIGDIWGRRIEKYGFLSKASRENIYQKISRPEAPNWSLRDIKSANIEEFRQYWSLPAIFEALGDPAPGFVTTHDQFAISFTRDQVKEKIDLLVSTNSEPEARSKFRLCSQNQWSYEKAKSELVNVDYEKLKWISYRIFDDRWTLWDRNVTVHRRERVASCFNASNCALVVCRIVNGEWRHTFVTNKMSDDSYISNRTKG